MRGVGEPRWCGNCNLVISGKYLSDLDGEHLVCGRCGKPVRVDETPQQTTDAVRNDGVIGLAIQSTRIFDVISTVRTRKANEVAALSEVHSATIRQEAAVRGLSQARVDLNVARQELDRLIEQQP